MGGTSAASIHPRLGLTNDCQQTNAAADAALVYRAADAATAAHVYGAADAATAAHVKPEPVLLLIESIWCKP